MNRKIGILASTRGTDIQAIIDAIESNKLNANIAVIISNKEDSYALERAKKHNIKAVFISPQGLSREEFDKQVDQELQKEGVDLVLLIGYMRYVSKWFVDKYTNKIMNIHPSLLPAFAGGMDKNVHQAIIDYGCKVTGCTIHFVDEGADTGPIIAQAAVEITEDESIETLKEKVQREEQRILLEAIDLFFEDRLRVKDRRVIISKK